MSTPNRAIVATGAKITISRGKRAVLPLGSGVIVNNFQELVRSRLRERTPNVTTLANFLKVDPSVMHKRLKAGGTALCLDFLDAASAFYQMSVSEMCALPGSLFQEIKPDEAQLLAHFRQLTYTQKQGLLSVLEGRLAQPAKAHKARWGRAELTQEQQALVDLYAQSEPQAREGVMKILKGTARKARDGAAKDDTSG
jgi:hypothetical protein